jgi:hypothetical protein
VLLTKGMELLVLSVDRNARTLVLGDRFGRSYELRHVDPYLLSDDDREIEDGSSLEDFTS